MIARAISRLADFFYIPPLQKIIPRQMFCYIFCGGINFLIYILCYAVSYNFIFAKHDLDMGLVVISPHIAALGVSLPVNFLVGFWLQRNVSFRHSPLKGRTQLFRYFLTALGGLLLTYLLTKLLVEVCHIYPTVSQIIIYSMTAVVSFLAQKHFTFRGAQK